MEIWKDIKGYEGIYQASCLGNLRSLNYKRTGKVQILKPATDNKGYLRTALMKDGILKTVKVHRVVLQAFSQSPENKTQVNHINGIKNDNRVENLEWCNNSENQLHAIRMGLTKNSRTSKAIVGDKIVRLKGGRGFRDTNNKVKISDEFLIEIFKEHKSGVSKRELARKYNFHRSIFRRIVLLNE